MAVVKITRTTVNRLRRLALDGKQNDEVRDVVQPGLSLRLTGRRLTWYLRYSDTSITAGGRAQRTAVPICAVDACDDPDKMRSIVAVARAALADGRDAKASVRSAVAKVLHIPETRVQGGSADPHVRTSTWSFGELREQFSQNPPDWLREETVKGYYRALARSQVGDLTKMLLVEIKPDDIRAVRQRIESRGKKRQANLTEQAIKTIFAYAAEAKNSVQSGIRAENNPAVQVITKRRKTLRTKEDAIKAARRISGVDEGGNIIINDPSLPSREDLGRLVRFLHTPGAFPLVKRCVLLLHLYSVQRRFTIATALRQTILHAPKAACGMWVLDGGTTKAGRPHVLPFSKRVYAVIEEWKRMLPPGDWLFPGMPTKAKPIPTGHLSPRTINAWLDEAWILSGASRAYGTHCVRKAFQTYLSQKGISLAERKLIVDHTEGRAGDVTEEHYNLDPQFRVKLKVITLWNALLDEFAERLPETSNSPKPDRRSDPIPSDQNSPLHNPTIVEAGLPAHQNSDIHLDVDLDSTREEHPLPRKSTPLSEAQINLFRAKLEQRAALENALKRSTNQTDRE